MDEEMRRRGMAQWWGQYLPPAGFPRPGPTVEATRAAGVPIASPNIIRGRGPFFIPWERPQTYVPGSAWNRWNEGPKNINAWIAPNPARLKNIGGGPERDVREMWMQGYQVPLNLPRPVRVQDAALRLMHDATSPYVEPDLFRGGWRMPGTVSNTMNRLQAQKRREDQEFINNFDTQRWMNVPFPLRRR